MALMMVGCKGTPTPTPPPGGDADTDTDADPYTDCQKVLDTSGWEANWGAQQYLEGFSFVCEDESGSSWIETFYVAYDTFTKSVPNTATNLVSVDPNIAPNDPSMSDEVTWTDAQIEDRVSSALSRWTDGVSGVDLFLIPAPLDVAHDSFDHNRIQMLGGFPATPGTKYARTFKNTGNSANQAVLIQVFTHSLYLDPVTMTVHPVQNVFSITRTIFPDSGAISLSDTPMHEVGHGIGVGHRIDNTPADIMDGALEPGEATTFG